jgi:hypothetical protein
MIGIEPLASLPPTEVAGLLAPTMQRYLTGDLGNLDALPDELPKPVDLGLPPQ